MGFSNIQWIKLEQIQQNDKYHIYDEEVQNMIVSIRRFGLRQNLEVRKIDDYHYVLINGEKRYRALKWLHENEGGMGAAPCLIVNQDYIAKQEREALQKIQEKIQRKGGMGAAPCLIANQDYIARQEREDLQKIQEKIQRKGGMGAASCLIVNQDYIARQERKALQKIQEKNSKKGGKINGI